MVTYIQSSGLMFQASVTLAHTYNYYISPFKLLTYLHVGVCNNDSNQNYLFMKVFEICVHAHANFPPATLLA